MKDHLQQLLSTALAKVAPRFAGTPIVLERPKVNAHGDFSSNLALSLARSLGQSPHAVALALLDALPASAQLEKVEIAGAGFLNFFLKANVQITVVSEILRLRQQFGCNNSGDGQKLQVEFVSANPTGPLHVGHARGAALGDSLSRILTANGYTVTREFYYNDAGAQIDNLTRSVLARALHINTTDAEFPEDGYRGEYIRDIAQSEKIMAYLLEKNPEIEQAIDLRMTLLGVLSGEGTAQIRKKIYDYCLKPEIFSHIRDASIAYLRAEQDHDLQALDVKFNEFALESKLYSDGKVAEVVAALRNSGHTFEKDGALWLRTTAFGDDKDRVMRKADGSYTYFVPDVAYHCDKWRRGFVRVINEQGADHHSTITRVRAGLQALNIGIPEGWPEYVLHQMVTVMQGGVEVKISKRAGGYLTLRDLLELVGADAVRYFLVSRRASSQLVFDIDLARAQSNDNPVFYIQYAHARICSVLREWGGSTDSLQQAQLSLLGAPLESTLLQRLNEFPAVVYKAGYELAPHLICNYLRNLASEFHSYYNSHKFLIDDIALREARLALILVTQQVIGNGLSLIGVSAPKQM